MAGGAGFVLWVLISAFALASTTILVLAQDQTAGFISIDCGRATNTSYADSVTGIIYVPDGNYIDSGEKRSISSTYNVNGLEKQYADLRSFPNGKKNCYTLNTPQVAGTKYLIRAYFMYGNYDAKNKVPTFDLYIGANYWTTVKLAQASDIIYAEMLHQPLSDVTHVCLLNTGQGTPFISVLESRLLMKDSASLYGPKAGSLNLEFRLNFGSSDAYRYGDDLYDRFWHGFDLSATTSLSTSKSVTPNDYMQPSAVMSTAAIPKDPTQPINLNFTPNDATARYYIYLHFAEIQTLTTGGLREFKIYLNDDLYLDDPVNLSWLSSNTIYSPGEPLAPRTSYNFSFQMTANSTHPPLLNAMETYTVRNMSQSETDPTDAEAVRSIKSAYSFNKIWQGDPCAPRYYSWEGLNCSFTDSDVPRIIALNLSSSNLNGIITDHISNLKLLEQLDLSNNSLTGSVPDFLSKMTSLKYLNLKGNSLTGVVPSELIKRSSQGSLTLNVEGNSGLCLSYPCNGISSPPASSKKTSLLIPIIASVVGVVFFILFILAIFLCLAKRRKTQGRESIQIQNRRFTYTEILRMTSNLSKNIGEGGFGAVYLGYLEDSQVQVAVKMLSQSSSQGYKEFKAEAQLLMIVHHRNLTSLIGYCDEGDNLGLIYEYMANGNLQSHISDKNLEYLTWEDRLHIALDSAQGLEYLHNGCKPPIVHRDIKPTNILLNDKFEAKLADFGLSRAFSTDAYAPTTMVAGTPGYLDPEYYMTQQLNEKSDVFSFGIVLLEIITSRPVMANGQDGPLHISKWVNHVLSEEGDIKAIVDRRLRGDYDTNSAWKAIEVAMSCVSATSNKRPNMSEVVSELSQSLSMEKSRKNEGFTTGTIDSVEMASYGWNNEFAPTAR
ncbi:hypothetical protein QQ045_028142 [Rhodiola kirilowii]